MNKQILLINPPQGFDNGRPRFFPTGLAYIAASLKQEKYSVDVLDFEIGQDLTHVQDLREYDLIGMTGYINHAKFIQIMVKETRRRGFNRKIVLGGMLPTSVPKWSLTYTGADIAVIGEGEETIKDIVREVPLEKIGGILYKSKTSLHTTFPRRPTLELDKLPFPAWEYFDVEEYFKSENPYLEHPRRRIDIVPTRGCFGKCIFCDREHHRIVRRRSLESVTEEIEMMRKQFGIEEVDFQSDLFISDKEWAREVIRAIARKKIEYTIDSRVDTVDRSLIRELRNSGCRKIYYGFESASQTVLDFLKKGIRVEQIEELINIHREEKLGLYSGFIIGVPFESERTVKKTVNFCKRNKISVGLNLPETLFSTNFFYLTPFPGTKLFETLKDEICLTNFLRRIQMTSDKNLLENLTINLTPLSDEELIALRERAIKEINNHLS